MLIKQKRASLERENGLIQGRLEGNVRLELELVRKTLANFHASKKRRVLKKQRDENQMTGEDLVSINPQ